VATTGARGAGGGVEDGKRSAYNLLVMREWMVLVPRCRECFEGGSVNALGFAGCFFVRDFEQGRVFDGPGHARFDAGGLSDVTY